jgi:hypothetical protein
VLGYHIVCSALQLSHLIVADSRCDYYQNIYNTYDADSHC